MSINPNDTDDDGIDNARDTCEFLQESHTDNNHNGIDDACDFITNNSSPELSDPPLIQINYDDKSSATNNLRNITSKKDLLMAFINDPNDSIDTDAIDPHKADDQATILKNQSKKITTDTVATNSTKIRVNTLLIGSLFLFIICTLILAVYNKKRG